MGHALQQRNVQTEGKFVDISGQSALYIMVEYTRAVLPYSSYILYYVHCCMSAISPVDLGGCNTCTI